MFTATEKMLKVKLNKFKIFKFYQINFKYCGHACTANV